MALIRTNLTLPEEVVEEVDAVAGPRGRSRYVAEAVIERLRRDRLRNAVAESRGVFVGTPHQMSRQQVSEWVDALRTDATD